MKEFFRRLAFHYEINPCWDEWTHDMLISINVLRGFTLIGFGASIERNYADIRFVLFNIGIGLWLDPEK